MRALITGANGFVAGHLIDHVQEVAPETELWGLLWEEDPRQVPTPVRAVTGDLALPSSLAAAVAQTRPDIVFHLAGATSVASSWRQPDRSFQVNALGTLNLLEALRRLESPPRVVVASSAEVYGAVPEERQPITETEPLAPISPYAASKAAQDLIAGQYHLGYDLATVRLRLFPHTGPRRPPQFAASDFARQIALIERGLAPPRVAVGNLEAVRDFSDVRDVARAYWLAAAAGRPGAVYNVGSGRGVTIGDALQMLLAQSEVPIEVVVDPARLRPADVPSLVGDPSAFRRDTGWHNRIPIQQTLGDLLDWWRDVVRREGG